MRHSLCQASKAHSLVRRQNYRLMITAQGERYHDREYMGYGIVKNRERKFRYSEDGIGGVFHEEVVEELEVEGGRGAAR